MNNVEVARHVQVAKCRSCVVFVLVRAWLCAICVTVSIVNVFDLLFEASLARGSLLLLTCCLFL